MNSDRAMSNCGGKITQTKEICKQKGSEKAKQKVKVPIQVLQAQTTHKGLEHIGQLKYQFGFGSGSLLSSALGLDFQLLLGQRLEILVALQLLFLLGSQHKDFVVVIVEA